jgi:hypothetical protein
MFWAYFNSDTRRTSLIPIDGDPDSPRSGVNSIVVRATYSTYLPVIL